MKPTVKGAAAKSGALRPECLPHVRDDLSSGRGLKHGFEVMTCILVTVRLAQRYR
jgi:hypothetical protein